MGGLSTLGQSTRTSGQYSLPATFKALADEQRAIRAGQAKALQDENKRVADAAQLNLENDRANRRLKIAQAKEDREQKIADAEYKEKYEDKHSTSTITNRAEHPAVKERMTKTLAPYTTGPNLINADGTEKWWEKYNGDIPSWKTEEWGSSRSKLEFARDNYTSSDTDKKNEAKKIAGEHGWIFNKQLDLNGIEAAIQKCDDMLLRLDPVVEKARRKRESDAQKAKLAAVKAKEDEGKTKELTKAQLIDDTRGHYSMLMKIMIDPDTGIIRSGQEKAYNSLLSKMTTDQKAIGRGEQPSWLKTKEYKTKEDLKKGYDAGNLTWDEVDEIMKERGWSE